MTNLLLAQSDLPILRQEDYVLLQRDVAGSGIRHFILTGLLVISMFVGGAAYWAVSSKLDGAVVAPASFVVKGNRKTVEHLEGGIVRNILVGDGDLVEAGQTLVELDSTNLDVDLNVLESQLGDLMVRRAYLRAQIVGSESFDKAKTAESFGVELDPAVWQASFLTQQALFEAERLTRLSEKAVLDQQTISFEAQISGLSEQQSAIDRQLGISRSELGKLETLREKGLVTEDRLNDLRLQIERLVGLDASLRTDKANASNRIDELKITALGSTRARNQGYSDELVRVESELATVAPRYVGAKAQQSRLVISAPVAGRVVGMTVFTNGGIVRPGAPILDIVPVDEDLVVEARVRTVDVDKVYIGQQTNVRLSGFGQSDVPEAIGTITNVSADSLEDERTGQRYFSAIIDLNEAQPVSIANLKFIPGMPADVFIKTGERTAFAYLVQPLKDRLVRTFVE